MNVVVVLLQGIDIVAEMEVFARAGLGVKNYDASTYLQMEIVVREASLFEMSLVLPRQKQMFLLCLCVKILCICAANH